MPSARVSTETMVKPGFANELAAGERHILSKLREVLRAAHVVVPLPADRAAGRVDPVDIPEPPNRRLAGIGGMHALLDELACAHLDMERKLRVDFVLDARPPEARAEPLSELHAGSSTFDTPVANRAHCSVSAASCLRPFRRDSIELGLASKLRDAPVRLDQAAALHSIQRRVERPLFHDDGLVGRFFDPLGDAISVAHSPAERLENERVQRAVKHAV